MVTKKDLIIGIFATFCLTVTLFMVVPISGIHPYDPRIDVNGDGKIDITDVAMTSGSFGTYGDPTRNVNVTNWPSPKTILYETYVISWNATNCYVVSGEQQKSQYVGDYTTMSILMKVTDVHVSNWNNGAIILGMYAYWSDQIGQDVSHMMQLPLTYLQIPGSQSGITSYQILAPYIRMAPVATNWFESQLWPEGNATISVLIHLSNGAAQEARSAWNEIYYTIYTTLTSISLGPYPTQGYERFTVAIHSNSTWYYTIYGFDMHNVGYIPIDDTFAGGPSDSLTKTYDVNAPFFRIDLWGGSGSQMSSVMINIYLIP